MEMTPHQVSVAAEAFAACLFAQAGCDVLIQYGANQPDYDFVAVRKSKAVRVSVKGTQWEGWGLIQNYKSGRTYHGAADAWLRRQPKDVVLCLVTFGKKEGKAPRCYLARASEIAKHHKSARFGAGGTTLWEDDTPSRGIGKGHRFKIPDRWKFSSKRVNELLRKRV
jgi:hypothetical protein